MAFLHSNLDYLSTCARNSVLNLGRTFDANLSFEKHMDGVIVLTCFLHLQNVLLFFLLMHFAQDAAKSQFPVGNLFKMLQLIFFSESQKDEIMLPRSLFSPLVTCEF